MSAGAAPGPTSRRFAICLAVVAAVALALRIVAAFWYDARTAIGGDAVWYVGVGQNLVGGKGFVEPLHLLQGRVVPSAAHPPLYPLFLAIIDFVRDDSLLLQRIWSTLPGTATVVLVGLVARDLAGERAGLVAAGLAAVSIDLFAQDVVLWSEGLYGFTVALTVFTAYRYLRRPGFLWGGLLAGAITLATLTRAEAALLYLILFLPLVLRTREVPARRRVATLGVGAGVALALMAPWLVYNNTGRFERPVLISVNLGGLLASSNCDATYSGEGIGAWGWLCGHEYPDPLPEDETLQEELFREAGLRYMRAHAGRLAVVVVPVRLLRTFGFWAPIKTTADDLLLAEGGAHWVAYVASIQYWLYLAAGIAGTVVLVRRRLPVLPLVAPVVTVAVITVIGYGTMRFRIALDVVLPVVAAVAIGALRPARRGSVPAPERAGV